LTILTIGIPWYKHAALCVRPLRCQLPADTPAVCPYLVRMGTLPMVETARCAVPLSVARSQRTPRRCVPTFGFLPSASDDKDTSLVGPPAVAISPSKKRPGVSSGAFGKRIVGNQD
jgi:hypothetical protein